jgi:hypothetical protein
MEILSFQRIGNGSLKLHEYILLWANIPSTSINLHRRRILYRAQQMRHRLP